MFSLIVITENVASVGKCVEVLPRHHTAERAAMAAWEQSAEPVVVLDHCFSTRKEQEPRVWQITCHPSVQP